jgi:hypothetical protein
MRLLLPLLVLVALATVEAKPQITIRFGGEGGGFRGGGFGGEGT